MNPKPDAKQKASLRRLKLRFARNVVHSIFLTNFGLTKVNRIIDAWAEAERRRGKR